MRTAREIGRFLLPLAVSVVLLFALWYLLLAVKPNIGLLYRYPLDVYDSYFTLPGAADRRSTLISDLLITLKDAGVGFIAGMIAAIIAAVAFVMFVPLQMAFMPLVMILRSVPLVALAPVIILTFQRGFASVAVMAGIVVFFPALVLVMEGLRSTPKVAQDLVAAYGGSKWKTMLTAMLPAAIPSMFAAARISVPGAIVGAMLAEFLGTGSGLGSSLVTSVSSFDGNQPWASLVIITLVSIFLYGVVGVLERFALARFGPDAGRV